MADTCISRRSHYTMSEHLLLTLDLTDPIVVTDCDKDNKEKKHETKNFKSPSVSEIEDAAKRWKHKYGNGETAININDYK